MNYWIYPGINKSAIILTKQNIKPTNKKKRKRKPISAFLSVAGNEPFFNLIEVISGYTGISIESMISKNRARKVVHARHLAMYFMFKYFPELRLESIGAKFGGRDHSTVIHAKKSIADLCHSDKTVRANVQLIDNKLRSTFIIQKVA